MYKLKINTPKFGIFDRENLALEYIRKSKFPIVIENDFTLFERNCNIYKTFTKARAGLQKIFENNNEKIVIENYIDSEPIYIYFICDGYNALKLISLERSSGKDYTTVSAMSEKISETLTQNILETAIYPLLDDIAKFAGAYTGMKINIIFLNFITDFNITIFRHSCLYLTTILLIYYTMPLITV